MGGYSCNWEITHACNYRCPYCPFIPSWTHAAEATNGRHKACSPDDWRRFWARMADLYGAFRIMLPGGEPFVYPGFIPLLRDVSRDHEVTVITNLSWRETDVIGTLDSRRVGFQASFHPHFADRDEFVRKAKELSRSGFSLYVTMVAYPEIFSAVLEHHRAISGEGLNCMVSPFLGVYQDQTYPAAYTQEQRGTLQAHWIKGAEQDFGYAIGQLNPKGKPCRAGQRYFRAYPDGKVSQCIAENDAPDAKPLGNIKDPDFTLRSAPLPCPAAACTCVVESRNLVEFETK